MSGVRKEKRWCENRKCVVCLELTYINEHLDTELSSWTIMKAVDVVKQLRCNITADDLMRSLSLCILIISADEVSSLAARKQSTLSRVTDSVVSEPGIEDGQYLNSAPLPLRTTI